MSVRQIVAEQSSDAAAHLRAALRARSYFLLFCNHLIGSVIVQIYYIAVGIFALNRNAVEYHLRLIPYDINIISAVRIKFFR